jgi:uncharacterized protein (UPF0335 family)
MPEVQDERLLAIVQRIECLMVARNEIGEDIRDVYAEAKAVGYQPSLVRWLIGRRAMAPDDRAESDTMQQVYEAAIGLVDGEGVPSIAEMRPDAAAIALNMLTADIVMLEDPAQAAQLVEHVLFLIDLRCEIALLRQQEGARRALAKLEGFDANQLALLVRWLEKCAKHGEEAMRAGEAVFHLYRGTYEARPQSEAGPLTGDAKLAGMFAPKPEAKGATVKQKQVSDAIAMAQVSRMNRGIG